MPSKYIGFDPLTVGENGFELFKSGEPFLSLYHDCKLTAFDFEEQKLTLTFKKVFDSKHGPAMGSVSHLILHDANMLTISGSAEGNFEDLNELTVLEDGQDWLRVRLTVGPLDFVVETKSIELKTDQA